MIARLVPLVLAASLSGPFFASGEDFPARLYEYRAEVVSVYDGDTITVNVDLGFATWLREEKIRLHGINAPEVRGPERPEGLKARDWLREKLKGRKILLRTVRDRKGKFGRYLATVFVKEGNAWVNVNRALIEAGHAEAAEY